jgi:hypothetical protein
MNWWSSIARALTSPARLTIRTLCCLGTTARREEDCLVGVKLLGSGEAAFAPRCDNTSRGSFTRLLPCADYLALCSMEQRLHESQWVTLSPSRPGEFSMDATKQFSFRLPETLVERVEHCAREMRESGLDVTRADVVRLLLNHALDTTQCKMSRLLRSPSARKSTSRGSL